MADCIPIWEDGERVTGVTTAAVIGCTFVDVSGARNADGSINVAPAAVNVRPFGVAGFDQAAVGGHVTVITGSKHIVPVIVGAAVAFGQEVMVDASARAIPWDGVVGHRTAGKAVDSQATVGSTCLIQLA